MKSNKLIYVVENKVKNYSFYEVYFNLILVCN